ncbi:response regulator transcription factor [Tessaracoccus sp. MC1865]|uniref:response regulator n=1 Tax=Tessaracoccus sp. MC1865 TaxID=2760310 RepID=UPI0016039BAB|nr:response regulator transcription factor [Tessaracoccus sp. MC1865]MBB1483073.1 response regulator transcription factor [Tessaracoccus sp. MC1865]QTO37497.1 response regulator transcription factor [Tessaracoccus sp. MC1865]
MNGQQTPIKVVIVDDHPVVRGGLVSMFAAEPGIDVVGEAGDGAEAVVVITAADPDVVLMDLRMAGGDGVDAIGRLRAANATRPRILVLTTYHAERDVRRAMEAGADGYLLKDARRAELVRAVEDLAQGKPVLTSEALAVLAGRASEQSLTERELDALKLMAAGHTNRGVAIRMHVSEATVKAHLAHVFEKLGVGDRASAVRVAYERGLL